MKPVVSLCLLAVVAVSCGKAAPSQKSVLELSTRLAQVVTDTATRTLAPIDTVMTRLRCDSGSATQVITRDGASYVIETTFNACKRGSDTLSGTLRVTYLSNSNGSTSVQLDGTLSYESATEAGNISFDALKITYSTVRNGDVVTLTSRISGRYSIGGTSYVLNEASVTTLGDPLTELITSDAGQPADSGTSTDAGPDAGLDAGNPGVDAGQTQGVTLTGANDITDLAALGEAVYFTGALPSAQPAIFSATATATTATTLCTGATDSKLSGVVVDGTTVYALQNAGSGTVKLVKTSTSGTGAACTEVATVDAQSFLFTSLAPMAKVGDQLVYLATDGSLKGYSLTANTEATIAAAGEGFFPTILGSGAIGVVAQAAGGTAPPVLKTFGAQGLAETLDSFSKPEFTVVGTNALWAVDLAGVAFKYRGLAQGSTVTSGPVANLGIPGRSNLTFCETNDGVSAGVAIAKSSDSYAGLYTVGLNTMAPIKVTDTTWDTPVLCAVTPTKLWAVEGDFGGTRHLLRFSR